MKLNNILKNKKVLVTGHTGFKGSWLSLWLTDLGAKVYGISIDVPSNPSHFNVSKVFDFVDDRRLDIRNAEEVSKTMQEIQPDFVFHLAAQALVRPSYESPLETLHTNALGTASVLDALRFLTKPVVAVMITSDKAYDNVEWVWGYKETDALGGPDPYSASKGAAELVIRSHVKSFFPNNGKVRIASARAGNVIGGGDWSQDRIIPDCVKAWSKGKIVELRKPHATRPWQHVLEPLSGYLRLAIELKNQPSVHGEAFNFGPPAKQNQSVVELVEAMALYWNKVKWKDVSSSENGPYESGLLKLNCDKALADLSWLPTLKFDETVQLTVDWYKAFYSKENQSKEFEMLDFTENQIKIYTDLANKRKVKWAL